VKGKDKTALRAIHMIIAPGPYNKFTRFQSNFIITKHFEIQSKHKFFNNPMTNSVFF